MLKPGTYRFTYLSGATRTAKDRDWNERWHAHCFKCNLSVKCWTAHTSIGALPGYAKVGWKSAAAAATTNKNKSVDIKITKTTTVRAWYQDNDCKDNTGSVSYCVAKVP